jgi:hypothetical protein
MAIECASTVEICAVRATRLDSDGTPAAGPNNVYIVNDILQLQVRANVREGEEREMRGGCGCVIASKSEEDELRRFDLQLDGGRLEPGLLEMLTGAAAILDSTDVIGAHVGKKLACGTTRPTVAFEAWTKRWTSDDEQDPVFPWWHWLWPRTAWALGDNTLQADFGPVIVTGKSRANTAWGAGPYGDMPEANDGSQLSFWADAGDLPVGTCEYSSVTVAT